MTQTGAKTAALILAAGRGQRFGGDIPKQYQKLRGKAVLRHTIEAFLALETLALCQIVIHPDDREFYRDAVSGLEDARLRAPVHGGPTRAETTVNGLRALKGRGIDQVLIHDGARPFVSLALIQNVLDGLKKSDGAFCGLPVVDALWDIQNGIAARSVPRDGLWRAQTPQGFRYDAILKAHEAQSDDLADDVAIARQAGLRVQVVAGAEDNFKITVAADLARGEALLRLRAALQ